jgi:hypothetical protein
MEWKQGLNGEALVEGDSLIAYITNFDGDEEMENWKARVVAQPIPFSQELDLSNPPVLRGAPYNEKGKRQALFMTSTEAKSTLNAFLKMTVKDLLLMPVHRLPEKKGRLPWE